MSFNRTFTPAERERILETTVWLGLAALFFARLSWNVVDLDLWHQMSLIRVSLAAGHLVTTDRFAYVPTLPVVVHHEWGAGVIAYFLARSFGSPGILLLKYALAFSIAALVVRCAKLRGASLAAFSALAPLGIVFVGLAFSPVRANLYSLFFLALLFLLLERDRRGNRNWIIAWLVVFPLWLNLHGGFVVGIGFLGIYCFEEFFVRAPVGHLVRVMAAMLLMIVLNPFGLSYYSYLWKALTMKRPTIIEWQPLWASFPSAYSVLFLGSLIVVAYVTFSLGRRALPGIGAVLAAAAAALLHQRMLPYYAVAFTCYVPAFVSGTRLGRRIQQSFKTYQFVYQVVWMTIAIFFAYLAIGFRPWELRVPGDGKPNEIAYPVGAVDYLVKEGFNGNIMTPFEYGAYVSWRMYPAVRISLDSRYEAAYPDRWVEESYRFYEAEPGWRVTLASYPTDIVLVRKTQPLSHVIDETGWSKIYSDRAFELYARNGLDLPPVNGSDTVYDGRFP